MSISALPTRIAVSPGRRLLIWLPTLVWLCVLASFSTDVFSAEHTGTVLWKIVHVVYPGISPHQFRIFHFLVRKTAHFVCYGVLGLLAFFAWRASLPAIARSHPSKPTPGSPGPVRWNLRWTRLALLLTLLAASLDELHQTFVYSRTGSARDVLLDMSGAVFFQTVIWLWLQRKT